MKKILLLMIALLFCVCFTYAEDTDWDCTLVLLKDKMLSDRGEDENDIVKTNMSAAMPKEAMEMAFDNLKAYCCDTEKIPSDFCESINSDVFYPQSIYLFDHILDVYLRRLDAKQQNDNWSDLLYGMDPDWSGLERRTFVMQQGNDVNWSLPSEMKKKYEKFWKKGVNITMSLGEKNLVVQQSWMSNTASAIKLYDNRTLFDKYNFACDLSNYIVLSAWIEAQWLTTEEYDECIKLIENRINKEKLYVQTIMSQKWEKLLLTNMDAYLDTYFVNNKLYELMQTVFGISTSFSEINRAVSRLIPNCS